jgi:hypothetical protein
VCQRGHDLLPNRNQSGSQRFPLGEKHRVQLAAGRLELGLHRRQLMATVAACGLGGAEVTQEDMPILQITEADLRASDDRGLLRGVCGAELRRNLEGISQFLRCDSHRVEPLGHVDRACLLHGAAKRVGAVRQARRQRALPAMDVLVRRAKHQLAQRASQLFTIEPVEALQQLLAPVLPDDLKLLTGFAQRGPGNPFSPPVEESQGHVHFPDASEPGRQPADSPLRLPAGAGHERKDFPDPARGDARAVQGAWISVQCSGKVRFQSPQPPSENGFQINS